MGKQWISHPRGIPMQGIEQISAATWTGHAQFTIDAVAGSAGVAIPFIWDGTPIKTILVRTEPGSQAGTIHAEIQGVEGTPDVNNVSGLPDGVSVTNGVASTAAILGGIDEMSTLTFATAPSETGLHWLVIEGSSGGTIDIAISYSADWVTRNISFGRTLNSFYHDGVDWNNQTTVGRPGVTCLDGSGNVIQAILDVCPPVLNAGVNLFETQAADNKEVVAVKFTAKDNLTELVGMTTLSPTQGTDMNYQMILAKEDGTVIESATVHNSQINSSTSRNHVLLFNSPVTIVSGETYRLMLVNPNDTSDDVSMCYFDATAADQASYFDMDSGEFALCLATDPPEYGAGGVGTWTDDSDKCPIINLHFESDISAISGGGGSDSVVGYA